MGSFLGVQPQVILVDALDQPVGVGDKWAVHQHWWCHLAYSVFIFRRH